MTRSAALFILLLSTLSAMSQSGDYTQVGVPSNSPQIPIPLGFIAPLTGQVHLEIPLATMPSRNGIAVNARFTYDTSVITCPIGGPPTICFGGGPKFSFSSATDATLFSDFTAAQCPSGYSGNAGFYRYFRIIDSSNQPHYISGTGTSPPDIYIQNCINRLSGQTLTTPPQSLAAPSGDGRYFFSIRFGQTDGSNGAIVWSIDGSIVGSYDTNGNHLFQQLQLPGEYTTNPVTTAPNNGSCGTSQNPNSLPNYVVTASDGTAQTYIVNCTTYTVANQTTVTLLTSLTLPDGTHYGFGYDPSHNYVLSSITLPTGGTMSFTYGPGFYGTLPQLISATFTGGTLNFTHTLAGSGIGYVITSTVTSPPRYDVPSKAYIKDKTVYTSTVWGGDTAVPFYLASAQYYSGTSTLLKTVTAGYSTTFPTNCLSSLSTTLNDTGQTAQTQYQYNAACTLMTQKQEFDYGATTPTRTTKISYLGDTSSIAYNSQYHIYNRPLNISVYAGAGTSGSAVQSTTYTYDEYGASYCKPVNGNPVPMLTNITGAINHDDAGHGSTFYPRGNATSISKLVSGSLYVTSHACYDTLGNVTQQVDANGNPTNFDYTDNWTDTACEASGTVTRELPTTITDAMGHRRKTTSYSCTRLPEAVADENDLDASPVRSGTTHTYDWASRPLCTNYPDGGQTCYTYFGTAQPANFTQATLLRSSPSVSITSQTNLDKYGRVIETQLTSDPLGTDYTDTTYDAFGRKGSVSNPYRTAQDSTYGVTNYYYDALGRSTSVLEPDGSATATGYLGNTITATDEAGKSRKSLVDALGRLTYVWEDPSSLDYETDYAYDVLDNLVSVNQKGSPSGNSRLRSYTYDSLSRLVCSANPEIQPVVCPSSATAVFPPGAVTYGYDGVGNVITKTSPAPNQPRAGTAIVTTTYTYDALNRLTGKSYSDGFNGNLTPGVIYGYDGANIPTCPLPIGFTGNQVTNGIGRRTAMCDSEGSASWLYDPMGRVTFQNRRLLNPVPPFGKTVGAWNGISNISVNTPYFYYLNGDLGSVSYPGPNGPPNYEFYTAENAAGQVVTAGDIFFNVLTNATYTPHGALATGLIGWADGGQLYNGSLISNTYNNRLQPLVISATTASNAPILNLSYNFNLGNGATGSDNGNVIQIVNGKDGTRTQNFLYDSLNRIQQAYTSGPNWGETYSPSATNPGVAPTTPGIDPWGNLTNRSAVTGKTLSEPLSCAPANASNQLNTCFSYDAAGNLIQNLSTTYTYDAENRLISSSGFSYVYDGDGQRIEKCTSGSAIGTCASNATGIFYYLTAGGASLAESDLGGNWSAAYGLVGGQIMSRVDLPANTVHYYFHDYLGSTSVITDNLGNIVNESDYYPYGGEIPIVAGDSNRYKFTGKERDSESGNDYFGARYYASTMGRWMRPDPAGMFAVRLAFPQTLNRYAYALNNPTSLIDPFGLDCAYLKDAGNGVESVDQSSNSGECGQNGGYWVNGGLTDYQINSQSGLVTLWGTTTGEDANGNQSYTFAQYQDTNLNISWDQNSWFNPLGHISIGIGNNQQVGLNPASDAQYVTHLIYDIFGCVGQTTCDALQKATVPGAILPQDPSKAVQSVSIPISGMQATMIQNAINQDTISPPNYSVLGPRPACDCGTWAQQAMSAGGVQSGQPAPIPQKLINQLIQIYGGR